MDRKADFFQKKMSNSRSFSRQRKGSNVWMRILLIIFILCIVWLVFWRAKLYEQEPENNELEFSLWQQINLQWELRADWDITTHTHTIDDVNYWVIRIKSDIINLSDYAWFVELTWVVEKFYEWNPIVKVITLSWTLAWKWENEVILSDENSWVYILRAGIQFLPSFFDEYVLLNEWENGEIHIQNIETEKEIVLKYFRCNSSDPSRNCKWLNESFENNHAQSFQTSEGDIYYRQGENQWFVANGDRWGIFINDISEEEINEKFKDLVKFANEKNINEWIKLRAASICQWSWERMQKITNSEINIKQEWLIVTVSWDWIEKQMTCQILVDYSLPAKWQLQILTIWDAVVISDETWSNEEQNIEMTWNIIEAPISATSLDTNVPQFPVKEEWLEYKSTRWWYSLQFPSSNISYSVSSVKENFGRDDVNCSYVINVIKYADKENLEVSPAIRIWKNLGLNE